MGSTVSHCLHLVQFSHSVVSDSATSWTAACQAPLCFTISGSSLQLMSIENDANQPSHPVTPFSSCPQSFPASGSFLMSQFFESGAQTIGVLASASALPVNIQGGFLLGLTGWISLQSKGLGRVFSNNTAQKHQFFGIQLSSWSNSHIHT